MSLSILATNPLIFQAFIAKPSFNSRLPSSIQRSLNVASLLPISMMSLACISQSPNASYAQERCINISERFLIAKFISKTQDQSCQISCSVSSRAFVKYTRLSVIIPSLPISLASSNATKAVQPAFWSRAFLKRAIARLGLPMSRYRKPKELYVKGE